MRKNFTPQPSRLLPLFVTVCALAVTSILVCSPCRGEERATPGNPPDTEITTEETSRPEDSIGENKLSPIERREAEEKTIRAGVFAITTHRQNYFLPATYYSRRDKQRYELAGENAPKNYEVKFQLSFKVLLWETMFWGNGDLFFAYTQVSFWQLYDKVLSSPFRESNYEPEVFARFDTDFTVFGFRSRLLSIGFDHQSNGQGPELSRSWNRVFAALEAERGDLTVALKPWYRIPESKKDDDNPNIEKYLGHGQLSGAYRLREHVFSFMLRDNLRLHDNKGAVELGWSHPITRNVRAYVQYFNGYGESLVDYNISTNRIGVGVMLNDWI